MDIGSSRDGARRRPTKRDLAFGFERIGLFSFGRERLVLIAVLLLTVAAAFGIARIRIDDSLSQLFRSNSPEFRQYEDVVQRFPSNEFDVLVVVEGNQLLSREPLARLRELVTDLQLVDGTRAVLSMFSAREKPDKAGSIPPPLFPTDLPEGAEYDALIKHIRDNGIIKGKLLSEDGQLALVVLALDPKVVPSGALKETIHAVRQVLQDDLAGTNLSANLSGVPVMQLAIRDAVQRDRIIYNAVGFLAGCLIAIAFFRRVSFMVVAAAPPLLAIVFALGVLGWLDFRLNMFLNIMTPLIMVISFSDSMQLTFAARERLLAGEDRVSAFRNAVLTVGPACALTHATAALSFTALQFTNSELIKTFGEAGLISTAIALIAVLTLVPCLGTVLVRSEAEFAIAVRGRDAGVDALKRFCSMIAGKMVNRPGRYSLIGLMIVLILGCLFADLQPRYRLADEVPDKQRAMAASQHLDGKLTGANALDVLVRFPPGTQLFDPKTIELIGAVQAVAERTAGLGNVWSIETLRRWIVENESANVLDTLRAYVDELPASLVGRFIDQTRDAVLVSARIPDKDASQLLPVIDELNTKLASIRASHPGFEVAVTGLSAIAARNSAGMIRKLDLGLSVEFLFVAAFIGVAFRSFMVFLVTLLPGIFPVVASGTLLWMTGLGLQFASVVALTVSFGLGLSATIHFLNRLRREHRDDESPSAALMRATILVGPALILTSVVLACGLVVTVFSDLPTLRLFGWLSAFSMLMALIADLFILRPTAAFLLNISSATARLGSGRREGNRA